ncbi:splicing factor 3A subunit 3-like [Artemia franciscana]|uniref:Matrin-type domain-containing protein n=1 Tax=Artemia franciscana TaxID=6661 RepID=A0AA88HTG4_ARTSF|nr:hypothetical protein QYM36_010171 [Artemia franciscana]
METLLELQRRYHEERERLIQGMVEETMLRKNSVREQLNSDHRKKTLIDRFSEVTSNLKEVYEDNDGLRKQELSALSGPNEFAEFYSRLKQIKDFHKKYPNEISIPMSVEFEQMKKERENPPEDLTLVQFSDEEGYGRYLDLHGNYNQYINLKGVEKVDYTIYLMIFHLLYDIPKERKGAEYRSYLEGLLDYLGDYVSRVKPLLDQSEIVEEVKTEFNKQWEAGTFPGWPKEAGGNLAYSGARLDLSGFNSWEELASLGLDRLKSALISLGLKCGGTLEERAQRLFSTKGKRMSEIEPSLFAKGQPARESKQNGNKARDIAFLEAQVYKFTELLSEQREATKENVERKLARTEGERQESDEEQGLQSDDEDEDDIPYNPKNLPLGWDGKPIPYWLYKLHGLNISYNCEICGNFTYKGPKAFQRHFAEWRHAHGMRCLGIPNTAHFANVTQIEDAVNLWAKLKTQKTSERWQAEEEEYEDTLGNVVNKRTYEDLKRQGLL